MTDMATSEEWKAWVTQWKASGQTAEDFAVKLGLSYRGLHSWAYRLGMTNSRKANDRRDEKAVRFLQIVPQKEKATTKGVGSRQSGIRVTMAGAVVDVQLGFDEATLGRVLGVVKAVQEVGHDSEWR